MLTPQEVSTHAFSKAVMGGYQMSAVDEFLDELTDDYTALYKENTALKAKMKVLVEKVEEYRATEDSMRATLLTAQRMADSIVREAEAKRDEILTQAESKAQTKIQQFQRDLLESEARVQEGRKELQRFIDASRELCSKELKFLDQLSTSPVVVPAAEPVEQPPVVEEIEDQVMAAFGEQPVEEAEPPAAPAVSAEEPLPKQEPAEKPLPKQEPAEKDYPMEDPFADSLESTRRINLNDLKFGRNYTGEEN